MNAGSSTGPLPPHRKIALLRGINVGKGSRIAMADLAECTRAAGCSEVRTVLATGNVIVADPRPEPELRAALETAYSERFGYTAVVRVLARDAVEEMVTSYPFDTLDEHHDYVVFSDDPEVTTQVVRAMLDATGRQGAAGTASTEAVAEGPGCIYWRVPRGATLSSDASKVLDRSENKRHLTTRNIKTLRKILAAG